MELKEEHRKEPVFNILSRAKKIGYYLDEEIWEYIELENGKFFVFESLAIERYPGVYSTKDPYSAYILVYPGLLYREVKREA